MDIQNLIHNAQLLAKTDIIHINYNSDCYSTREIIDALQQQHYIVIYRTRNRVHALITAKKG